MKTSPIGQYRHRVLIQRPEGGQDAAGGPLTGFVDVQTVWASIRNPTGAAAIKAGAEVATARTSIRVRWRTDVLTGWRLVHGATVYGVVIALPDEEGRAHVDLVCEVVR